MLSRHVTQPHRGTTLAASTIHCLGTMLYRLLWQTTKYVLRYFGPKLETNQQTAIPRATPANKNNLGTVQEQI